jgi:arylsulfatase A-like enzyme
MAKQGIRAVMSYSPSSVCSPSRASIFSERQVGALDCIRGNRVALAQELPALPNLNFVQELQKVSVESILLL